MKQGVQKALYGLHSWSGLALGLVLYVLSLSGVVALFHDELSRWQRGVEPTRVTSLAGLDRVLAERATPPAQVTILLPTGGRPWATLFWEAGAEDGEEVDAASGESIAETGTAVLDLIVALHTDLLLPQPFGRYLVGLLGMAMLALVISGVLLHRKFLREFFTLRLRRSARLRWTDLHKSIGLWVLPFHFMMAFTGALLGLLGLMLLLAGLLAFRGDAAAAQAALFPSPPAAAGHSAPMLPLQTLVARAEDEMPGLKPEVLTLHHYGDRQARLEVYGNVPGRLVYYPMVALSPVNGETHEVIDWSRESLGRRLFAMVTPLHYGSFGGILIKGLYALLGAGTCLLIFSGLKIWLTRPLANRARRPRLTWWLMDGVIAGLPFSLTALMLAGRLFPALNLSPALTLWTFLLLWLLVFGWTGLRPRQVASSELMLGTGLLLIGMALGDGLFCLWDSGKLSLYGMSELDSRIGFSSGWG